MRIVIGRGVNRRVVELPCGRIVQAAPEKDQKAATAFVCELIGIAD